MPGVPSGRGCDACRAQKKKCDQGQPACARCTRLQIACVGSGQRRYKFKEEFASQNGEMIVSTGATMTKTSRGAGAKGRARHRKGDGSKTILVPPAVSSGLTLLVNGFIDAIKCTTDLRFNLAWSYGGYLRFVPKRLGRNEALDTSALALISAHSNLCSGRGVTPEVLVQYSRALSKLRECLSDPAKARAAETLCAVMLLMVCQVFIGVVDNRGTRHGEGAAQILKARGYYDPKDDFESILVLSLRGPVVWEGLFNPKIQFTPSEWQTLVENDLDGDTWEGKMMGCLCRLPGFMRRGRAVRNQQYADPKLLLELEDNYETTRAVVEHLRGRLVVVEGRIAEDSSFLADVVQAHSYVQRSYGIAISICLYFNCVLRALRPDSIELFVDATDYATEVLTLAENAKRYRPLGTTYVQICLAAAWMATTDCSLRWLLQLSMDDYRQDFPQTQPSSTMRSDLEQEYRHLHLIEDDLF